MIELVHMATSMLARRKCHLVQMSAEGDDVRARFKDRKTGRIFVLSLVAAPDEDHDGSSVETVGASPLAKATSSVSPDLGVPPDDSPAGACAEADVPELPLASSDVDTTARRYALIERSPAAASAPHVTRPLDYQIATQRVVDVCLKSHGVDEKARALLRMIRPGPFRPHDDNAIVEATRIATEKGNLELLRSIAARINGRVGRETRASTAPPAVGDQ
jgi:hypothetical protein